MIPIIKIVIGMPGSGKSTWVNNHLKSNDIVYDLDRIAGALTYSEEERHNRTARQIAVATRQDFFDTMFYIAERVQHKQEQVDFYIISTSPKLWMLDEMEARRLDTQIFFLSTKYKERNLPRGVEDKILENIADFLDQCEEKKIPVYRIV